MTEKISEPFVLIITVGGSPEPLNKSIRHYAPTHVIFVASQDSRPKVKELLQENPGIENAIITLSDHQNLLTCVRELREQIPKKLSEMKLDSDTLLIADITGGTKVMSSALTLAMMEFRSRFSYIGGSQREKSNLGTVKSGCEKVIATVNPWDAIGLREARVIAQAFNAGQYETAREAAKFLASRDNGYRKFYENLALLMDAFHSWDIFDYKSAERDFARAFSNLEAYANPKHHNFRSFYAGLKNVLSVLETTAKEAAKLKRNEYPLSESVGRAYVQDLVSNARRCARRGRYDDAVARLYSAVEKIAKIALAQKGMDNSKFRTADFEQISEEMSKKYLHSGETVGLPLSESFAVLMHYAPEDQLCQAYQRNAEELAKRLQIRNSSLLAHGYNPVKEEDYRKLLAVVLGFLGMAEDELLEFPELDPNAILF